MFAKRGPKSFLVVTIILSLAAILSSAALGHEEKRAAGLADPVFFILLTSGWVLLASIFLFTATKYAHRHKRLFFLSIVIPVSLSTLYLGGYTIYENITSVTKGPVHWHADYQVWACGEKQDLINPKGLSNKVGTSLLHEHDDDRIHVEGTLASLDMASLGEYFEVIGGSIRDDAIAYPTNSGIVSYKDGDSCPDGSTGTLKVYVNGNRIEDPAGYIMTPELYVPPGDCIIIEFDSSNEEKTSRVCDSWLAQNKAYWGPS